jgi:hypothetical protein
MTVSMPFWAPAWPPDTGASMNCQARLRGLRIEFARHAGRCRGVVDEDGAAAACRRRRHPAARVPSPWSAPSVTLRRSSSLPTQQNTMSAALAAAFAGVAALRGPGVRGVFGTPGCGLGRCCGCRP